MGDKVDIFMPVYIGDYLADTTELAAEEHGAYMLLMFTAWRRGGRLPNDQEQLRRAARVDERRWKRVWGMIARFFTVDGDSLVQARLTKELERALARRESAAANGRASAAARRYQRTVNGRSTGVGTGAPTDQSANAQPTGNSSPSPSWSVSGSGSESDLDANQAGARSNGSAKLWPATDWFARFKKAWVDHRGTVSYGGPAADFRATGELQDELDALAPADRMAAQARAPQMFAEFLGDEDPKVAAARHPWSWFAGRFNGLRVPRPAARRSGPVTRSDGNVDALTTWLGKTEVPA
jgi:uncharacterized protein YdaU (DUF1376 family)